MFNHKRFRKDTKYYTMSKRYIISNEDDFTAFGSQCQSMLYDVIILFGIYRLYEIKQKNNVFRKEDFINHYKYITNEQHHFIGRYAYFNCGFKYFRDFLKQNKIKFSRKIIKRLCYTNNQSKIYIHKDSSPILYMLFDILFQNEYLQSTFYDQILTKCVFPKVSLCETTKCTSSLFGHVADFLHTVKPLTYSHKDVERSKIIISTMEDIIIRYNIQSNCPRGRKP